jgi:hypothetical protein
MKTSIFLIIFLSVSTFTSAQWYFGIKAGPTLSNYKTKTPWKEVSNLGYHFGATAYKQIDEHVGINFELQYIQKGYYHKICNSITDKLQANYLELPFMINYGFRIPGLKNFKGHASLGLYAAYWLNGKYQTECFDANNESFDFKKSNASRFDFGPNAGVRVEYLLKKGSSVSVGCRYELGLLDLQKSAGDNSRNTNRALVIGVSYLTPLSFK